VMAMLNWHRRHRFCANCGNPTNIDEAGYLRHCPRCGANHFPRTDPVVIMTVEHDDRLLLGRRAGWPAGRVSVLAGFVSPGESAEEAVTREVEEESGIVARDPVFVASQPWPFPASLMLGFHAVSDGGEPRATDGELEEVSWLGRDAVQEAIDGGDPGFQLPPPVSIARFLIDRWAESRGR
jgi:NAD+ diphosphatase